MRDALRLGEAMVKEGLITNETLARALERQIIFGGRLGTNLVEMNAVSEEMLAKFLGKILHVPYAGPEVFEEVPKEVIEAFPPAMAEKYTAFPIKKERSRIHLVMKDPNELAALDEIRFITGLDVRPYISSEIRIVFALEKYYGIKRSLRYVNILEEEKAKTKPAAPAPAARPAPEPGPEPVPETPPPMEEYLGDESQTEFYGGMADNFGFSIEPQPAEPAYSPQPAPAPAQPAYTPPPPQAAPPAPQPQPAPQPPPAPPAYAPPAPVQPAPAVQAAAPVQPAPAAARTEPAPPAAQAGTPREEDAYESLANPRDREHVAESVLRAALEELARAALFLIKGSSVTGWKASGPGLSDQGIASFSMELDGPCIFKDAAESKLFYKGPLLRIPGNAPLLEAFGGTAPTEAIAFPLIIKGKVVGILYGDSGPDSMVKGDVSKLESLMSKASMSLEILILKNKILGG